MRIVRYLKDSKATVALIVLLLIVQAFTDLSLPKYTSLIVDVGIQQSGVSHVTPNEMRASTHTIIAALIDDTDSQLFDESYSETAEGTFVITDAGEQATTELDEMLAEPLVVVAYLEDAGTDLSSVATLVESGLLDTSISEQFDSLDSSLLEQQAIQATISEYKALGTDMGAMQMNYLLRTGFIMLCLAALGMAVAVLVSYFAARTAARVGHDLRLKLFTKVVSFSEAEVQGFSAASLITRGTNDIQQVQNVTVMLLRMVLNAPIIAIGGIIMVSTINLAMGWIIALGIALIGCLIVVLMRVAMPKFRIMQTLIDKVNLVSRETLTGLPVVRAFGREAHEEARFDIASTKLMETQLFTNRVMAFMMPSMMLVMNAVSVLIVWVGGHYIDAGTIQTGDMIAFITYSMIIIMSFFIIGMISVLLPRANVAAARIDEVLSTEVSICDPERVNDPQFANDAQYANELLSKNDAQCANELLSKNDLPCANGLLPKNDLPFANGSRPKNDSEFGNNLQSENGEEEAREIRETHAAHAVHENPRGLRIAFDDVSFRYSETSAWVLHHISFVAEPGQTTAIIGSTGSGKTTVLKLIERFFDATEGSVTIDGIDVRDMPQHELRAMLGYVPQQAFLFSGTIESNIAYVNPSMPPERVERAAAIAQAADFIASKDDGFASDIAQGGTNVSGGQRQRLAIARALASNARAFLFDDSFSALDYKTDAALRAALHDELAYATVVIVAQRIASVLNADQIIVLDEGRVVGKGTHAQLLASCDAYREIAASQLSAAELAASEQVVGAMSDDASASTLSAPQATIPEASPASVSSISELASTPSALEFAATSTSSAPKATTSEAPSVSVSSIPEAPSASIFSAPETSFEKGGDA